jgi:acetolactate synthase I/II/III large subunit
MNELSGAQAMVRLLEKFGVKHIFGLCGDTSLPFYDALATLDHDMEHILSRDERSAGYMADVYARLTGKVGVCEGPSGGGATYILPALAEANESSISVLGITTDISVTSRGRYALTELDQKSLFKPVTKWNAVIDRSDQVPGTVRAAFRAMTTGRPGAAHIGFPFDVQKGAVGESDMHADGALGEFPAYPVAPHLGSVAEAVRALSDASSPLIICGGGPVIAGAQAEIAALATRLDAPVATTISGQGIIAETHPLALGVVGSNGGVPATRAVVQEADVIIFIGCRAGSVTTERWRFPEPGAVRVVHIDVEPEVVGANYPTQACVIGDAKLATAALVDALGPRPAGLPLTAEARIRKAREDKLVAFTALAASSEAPIRPERLVATLQSLLSPETVIVLDPGTPCPYFSAYYTNQIAERTLISNRAHGALGFALPGVIGAARARPGQRVVAVMGDGSFGFAAGEMETMVRLGLNVTLIVVSNAVFGWIKAGQKTGFDGRYFSVDFGRSNHAAIAEAFGMRAWQVADPDKLSAVLKTALEYDGPTLVDVISQPLHEANAPVSEWVA